MFNTFDRISQLSKKETLNNFERAQAAFMRFKETNPAQVPEVMTQPHSVRGREVGRHWAVKIASPGQLDWLDRLNERRKPGDSKPTDEEEAFWSELPLGDDDKNLLADDVFRAGFTEAALEVWRLMTNDRKTIPSDQYS